MFSYWQTVPGNLESPGMGEESERMRKPAEEIEQEWLPCSSRAGAPWANKKEANVEYLRFSPATP